MKSYVKLNHWVIVTVLVASTLTLTNCSEGTNNLVSSDQMQTTIDSLETVNTQMNGLLQEQVVKVNDLNQQLEIKDNQIGSLRNNVYQVNKRLRQSGKGNVVEFFLVRYDTLGIPENFVDVKSIKKVTLPEQAALSAMEDLLHGDSIAVEFDFTTEKLGLTEAKVAAQDSVINLQNQQITNYVEVVNTQNSEIQNIRGINAAQQGQISTLNKKLKRTRVLGTVGTLLGFGTAAVR